MDNKLNLAIAGLLTTLTDIIEPWVKVSRKAATLVSVFLAKKFI